MHKKLVCYSALHYTPPPFKRRLPWDTCGWWSPLQTYSGSLPLTSFTLIKSLVLLRTLRVLDRVLYWPQPLRIGLDMDKAEGRGSPADVQLLLSSDPKDKGAS